MNQTPEQINETRPSRAHASRKKLRWVNRNTVDDPLMAEADVLKAITLGRTRFYELLRAGDFPPPRQVSTCRVAWKSSAVQFWIDQRPVADAYQEVEQGSESRQECA